MILCKKGITKPIRALISLHWNNGERLKIQYTIIGKAAKRTDIKVLLHYKGNTISLFPYKEEQFYITKHNAAEAVAYRGV